MRVMTSRITGVSIVFSAVCSGADQRIHQRSASLAFVRGIHHWVVDCQHKGSVMRKMFPFDDVIMKMNERRVESGPEFWHNNNQGNHPLLIYSNDRLIIIVPLMCIFFDLHQICNTITVASYEHLISFFNSLLVLTTIKHKNSTSMVLRGGGWGGIQSQ